mgnify:CR=1 FL=1
MENLLTKSVEFRAIELIKKGVDPIEAVKQSLVEEMDLIGRLLTSSSKLSEKGKAVSEVLFSSYLTKV